MKKHIALIVAIILLMVLTSCGSDSYEIDLPDGADDDMYEAERTTITLGIIELYQSHERQYGMRYVPQFNAENERYYIEVVNYLPENLVRLRTEMVAGRGPDILYCLYYEHGIFAPMMNLGMLVDLNAFIDADPDISRDDFFQNILDGKQNPDGSLQIVANRFSIDTLISVGEVVDSPELFTADKFHNLLRNAFELGIDYPLGELMSGSEFVISNLMFVDLGIIDFDVGVSNFQSQAFYDLLEIASLLPEEIVIEPDFSFYRLMTIGEQLFSTTTIFAPLTIARHETILGDFTILGYPSDEGGIHGASLSSVFGINASSNHQDAAWSFVRKYFLPSDSPMDVGRIPLRIDAFDELVRDTMRMSWYTRDGGINIPIRGLTVRGATKLRELVESISFVSKFDLTIMNMVMEELTPFMVGTRSAEETARIIQSRVQIYLHEHN